MQYNKVEICGVNTSKLKVLSEKEKMELLRRVKEGDKEAREKLIKGNLRLVLSVIQRFTNIELIKIVALSKYFVYKFRDIF